MKAWRDRTGATAYGYVPCASMVPSCVRGLLTARTRRGGGPRGAAESRGEARRVAESRGGARGRGEPRRVPAVGTERGCGAGDIQVPAGPAGACLRPPAAESHRAGAVPSSVRGGALIGPAGSYRPGAGGHGREQWNGARLWRGTGSGGSGSGSGSGSGIRQSRASRHTGAGARGVPGVRPAGWSARRGPPCGCDPPSPAARSSRAVRAAVAHRTRVRRDRPRRRTGRVGPEPDLFDS
jgi:hypothetical protein